MRGGFRVVVERIGRSVDDPDYNQNWVMCLIGKPNNFNQALQSKELKVASITEIVAPSGPNEQGVKLKKRKN